VKRKMALRFNSESHFYKSIIKLIGFGLINGWEINDGAVSMKNKIITIALLAVFVLGACTEAQPSQLPPTLIPSPTSALHAIPFVTYPPFNTPLTPVFTYVSPTSSPTVTATPTLDYAALGLPSPTATPTFDLYQLRITLPDLNTNV